MISERCERIQGRCDAYAAEMERLRTSIDLMRQEVGGTVGPYHCHEGWWVGQDRTTVTRGAGWDGTIPLSRWGGGLAIFFQLFFVLYRFFYYIK